MTKETKKTNKEEAEAIVTAVSKTETFIRNNKGLLYGLLIAIILIVAAYVGYNRFISAPKKAEAMQQTFPAEQMFRNGNYELALNGDGNILGFAQIIDNYGAKGGKAVYLYAGICELELGNYSNAISYLEKYKGKEPILKARALACIGDSYVGLGDYATAVTYFEKAAGTADNMFAAKYLLKAGVAYEELGNYAKALECYQNIKDNYPQSSEGYDIEKYISRIEVKK